MRDQAPGTPCAICGKPVEPLIRPFCSARCAEVDLQRWLSNRYAVQAEDDGEQPNLAAEGEISGQAQPR